MLTRIPWTRTLWTLSVAAIALTLIFTEPAHAGSGGSFALPFSNGNKVKNGLTVDVVLQGWTGAGYRRVSFNIRSIPPAPRNRSIRVDVLPNSHSRHFVRQRISAIIEIPEASTVTTHEIMVPQSTNWHWFRVEFFEDGKMLEDLSMENSRGTGNNRNISEAFPSMLFIDSDASDLFDQAAALARQKLAESDVAPATHNLPDVRPLATWFPLEHNNSMLTEIRAAAFRFSKKTARATDIETMELIGGLSNIEMINFRDLPQTWLGLSSIDLFFISRKDLDSLIADHPRRWQSVRRTVAAGATMFVHQMDVDDESLSQLASQLELPPNPLLTNQTRREPDDERSSAEASQSSDDDKTDSKRKPLAPDVVGWKSLSNLAISSHSEKQIRDLIQSADDYSGRRINSSAPKKRPPPDVFRMRSLGFGQVVAVAYDEPFYQNGREWNWALSALPTWRWMWYERHGMSMQRENDDFWNFLIPGTGKAPVNSFLLLITAFAVVVGPVNYFFLRKTNRMYLLLLTVPAAATILTSTMLAYAVVSDGLATRLRSRSITEIDQTSGRSVSWSRQSYYSGLAPSEGLRYPNSAAVYPIHYRGYERNQKSRLDWRKDQQLLREGFHRSRVTSQFLVIDHQLTDVGLDIQPQGLVLNVTNRLQVAIEALVIADQSGQLFAGRAIENGVTSTLSRIESVASDPAAREAANFINERRPQQPEGFDADYHTRSFAFRFGGRWTYDHRMSDPESATSILEQELRRLHNGVPSPRTYFAVTSAMPSTVPRGIDRVDQQQSVHVIRGRW